MEICRTYFYGVVRAKNNDLFTFCCKQQKRIPSNAIIIRYGILTVENANALSQKMLKEINIDLFDEQMLECHRRAAQPNIGDIIIYADIDGQHTAVILQFEKDFSTLILTGRISA